MLSMLLSRRVRAVTTGSRNLVVRFGSTKSNPNAAIDSRLAGRRRFYKQVGVIPVMPPWVDSTDTTILPSPISAGVDGSSSANGVCNTILSHELRKKHLQPNTDHNNWFGITLDGRSVSTPLGSSLSVPSRQLAWMIAAEWDAQEKELKPTQMPLMTLACTALDQTANAMHVYQQQALSYLPTDTLCFWVDAMEERVLYRKQQKAWEKIHTICEQVLGDKPAMTLGVTDSLWLTRKAKGLPHPPKVMQEATALVHSLNAWELTALASITTNCKSILIGLAMLYSNSLTPAQASTASRVEEEFNIDNWGLVEGGHDYDRLNSSIQLHAAEIMIQTTRGKPPSL